MSADSFKLKVYQAPLATQFWYLLVRAIVHQIRLPHAGYVKVLGVLSISVMMVLVFGEMISDCSEVAINDRAGILGFIVMFLNLVALNSVCLLFSNERRVFLKEQISGTYSASMYFMSKVVSELPLSILNPTILSLILYFAIGLNTEDASHYFIFNITLVLFYI